MKKTKKGVNKVAMMQLSKLMELVPDAMIIVSTDGIIRHANLHACNLFGYKNSELQNSKVEKLLVKNAGDILKNYVNEYLKVHNTGVKSYDVGLGGLKMDGSEFPAKVLLNSVDIHQELLVTLVFRDLSAINKDKAEIEYLKRVLEKKTEEVEVCNDELESFSYSVSHDLKAPLRTIMGFSNILLRKHADHFDEEGKRVVNVIVNHAEKMDKLIGDILTFSKLMMAKLTFTQLDLQSLFRESYEKLVQVESKNREIEFNIGQLPAIRGDKPTMMQAISQLVSNALKYTRPIKKTIIVVGWLENENVIFIKDNGVGFDNRYIDKLFAVFQRLHSETEFEGTGVGLAMVHRIVQRHHGKVWAESIINKGATFYIQLPDI